jgi:hypothetical protein
VKRSLLRFGLPAILGISALAMYLWWTAPRISWDSASKLHLGMTKSEVLSILNCEPQYAPGEYGGATSQARSHVWASSEVIIHVRFDDADIVVGCGCKGVEPESLPQRIRRWLRIE